eukprot:17466_1
MGVDNLWMLLDAGGTRITIDSLATRKLAVDASLWLVQFIKAMRTPNGEMMDNCHLLGLFRRICKLLFYNIKPVFVFDGPPPKLKRKTLKQRRIRREKSENDIKKQAERLFLNRCQMAAISISKKQLKKLQKEKNAANDNDDNHNQKKKKKRKKKKKNKSLSKSPKSDKKKKRKREMDDKEDTTDTVQQTLRNNPMPMPMPMNVVQPAVPNAMNLVQMTHKPPSNTQHIMVERMNHEQVIHAPMIRPIKEAQQVTVHVKHEKPTDSNSESDKSSTDTQRDAMSEDSNELNKNNIESEESDEDSDLIEEEEEIQENESNDPWIDCHVTITIDGDRFDGIVEKRKQKEGDENVMYKIKFDTSNWRESEWVRADQMQIQQITTCENFKIGDVVVVREHGEWMEDAIANVRQVYQGATGVIVQAVFPEFDGVFMYCRLRDVKKTGNVSH